MSQTTGSESSLAEGFDSITIGASRLIHADCFQWLAGLPPESLHAIVTDPPYGVREYDADQLEKRASGRGGLWRIPPAFDGKQRSPLPRFTALDPNARKRLSEFFEEWSRLAVSALRPGAHVLIATNAFVAPLLYHALQEGGLEFRGEIIRLVRTLRGGDRPKNAEAEFPGVSSLPRGGYEPWGVLRKPLLKGMTVGQCLRTYQTGGLRRYRNGPFEDVIASGRTPLREKAAAPHPSLKPQALMRRLVYASLPLGQGIVADPFMGSGSTIAAAEALGLTSVGVEQHRDYFQLAQEAISPLREVECPELDDLLEAS